MYCAIADTVADKGQSELLGQDEMLSKMHILSVPDLFFSFIICI